MNVDMDVGGFYCPYLPKNLMTEYVDEEIRLDRETVEAVCYHWVARTGCTYDWAVNHLSEIVTTLLTEYTAELSSKPKVQLITPMAFGAEESASQVVSIGSPLDTADNRLIR